jgi:hypothetical protein
MPYGSLAGLTINQYGPEAAPVSLFLSLVKGEMRLMRDIYGRSFSVSSPSAVLQQFLENRLQAAMDVGGSPEYELTWKHWDMPSGAPICALRASARRTSASGSTGVQSGWPTPEANGTNRSVEAWELRTNARGRTVVDSLQIAAQFAGWATPAHRDYKSNSGTDEFHAARAAQTRGKPLSEQVDTLISGWATPAHRDGEHCSGQSERTGGRKSNLTDQATLGQEPSGSPASTGRRGALNPAFSLWLMGYPPQWMASAPSAASARSVARATPSSRK